MTFVQSLLYALFCMTVVFCVLIILCIIIKLFSLVIGLFRKNTNVDNNVTPLSDTNVVVEKELEMSSGKLKLHNVDERTAAMVMAIVSDESGIPLEELCFKSIKAKN